MRPLILAVAFAILGTSISHAQSQTQKPKDAANWDSFRFLLGEWIGEGTGAPGEGTGGFSFEFDLQGKVIVRKNRADYPGAKDKPAYSHTDLQELVGNVRSSAFRRKFVFLAITELRTSA